MTANESVEAAETQSNGEQTQVSAENLPQQTEQVEDTAAETQETQEAQEKVELRSRQLLAIARREEYLRKKEAELKERETTISTDDLRGKFAKDPIAALRELGVDDLSDLATQLWMNELGDDAPEEFKRKHEYSSVRAEIEALKSQLEAQRREAEQAAQTAQIQAQLNAYAGQLATFVKAIPEDLAALKLQADSDPEQTYETLGNLVQSVFQSTGELPDLQQLAKEYDQSLRAEAERYFKLFGTSQPAQEEPAQATKSEEPKTLSDADTSLRGDKESLDDLDDEEFRKRIRQKYAGQLFKD